MKLINKKSLLALLFCTSLFAQPNGVYVEAGVGTPFNDTLKSKNGDFKYDNSLSSNIAIGYQLDLYRFELEGRYTKNSLYSYANLSSDGDLEKNSQMLNVYYSGYNSSPFFTSVGLGAGVSSIKIKNVKQLGSSVVGITNSGIFSAQAMLSVGYMITEHIATSVKYNYLYTTKSDDFDAQGDSYLSLTFRYLF